MGGRQIEPVFDDTGEEVVKKSAVQLQSEAVTQFYDVIQFRNRPMVLVTDDYPHYIPLTKERFDRMFYSLIKGQTRSRVGDVYAQTTYAANDLTDYDHLILFGLEEAQDDGTYHKDAVTKMWDTRLLDFVEVPTNQAVWRSPYGVIDAPIDNPQPVPFIMSLAGNDAGKYDDIMQSLAPLIMERKPDGVIWWVGDGANGKSTLMDAIYRIFPGQLASITVKSLADGRDTPRLNGALGNIVKESSEGRIDDTEIYKAVGTHEDFTVHKFHSQDTITIRGNMHHVFSANNIPVFNDKGFSARRRTFIVPFTQRFESDPTFEERTFNAEMFGRLIAEMCRYARKLRDQNYRYKFSSETLAAKEEYDTEANNAEEYTRHIVSEGIVAFDSFNPVRMDYENWCADMGYVPLGVSNLRRAVQAGGFDRTSIREGNKVIKKYRLRSIDADAPLQPFSIGRPGLFTTPGFVATTPKKPDVPEFHEPQPTPDSAPPEPVKPKQSDFKW